MNLTNVLKLAYRSLSRSKFRSFLTMLGIIIGTASVIAMLAIGQGSRDAVQSQIASLGTNVVVVFPGAFNQGGVRMEAGTIQRLDEGDAVAMKQQCPAVQSVSPLLRIGAQVVTGSQNWRTSVYGAYPEYFAIRSWQIQNGAFFTDTDERGATKVCAIGKIVSDNLFGEGVDPTGKIIRIKNIPFKVIGLLAERGQNALGQDQDDVVIAPFSTVQKRIVGSVYAQTILASARSADQVDAAVDQITDLLRDRHKLNAFEDNDFTVRTQADLGNAAEATSRILTVLLASIASISLIVGGIGIMNIMLVSVTERTREIGLRMAVGARSRDVLLQFLVEAVALSFAGGVFGIVLGASVSQFISRMQSWPITVTPASVGVSFLFAAATGIFFGWYPARKAANLNPIDALRYE